MQELTAGSDCIVGGYTCRTKVVKGMLGQQDEAYLAVFLAMVATLRVAGRSCR